MNKVLTPYNKQYFSIFSFVLVFFLSVSDVVLAHDAFSGSTEARLEANGDLRLELNFSAVTVEGFVGHISDRDNQVSSANLHNLRDYLNARAKTFYRLTIGEQVLVADTVDIDIKDSEDAVIFRIHYPGPIAGTVGFANEFIAHTNPEFRSTLTVLNAHDAQLGLFIHTVDERYNEVLMSQSSSQAGAFQVFKQFLALGVHHILLGYDHLLFLMGLLVVCRNWRMAISIVTCFTIAHSLTLCIAALDLVTLSSYWVESAIALSILYVGVENFWTSHQPRMRWLLTSVFGLVHGLGFASVLRDIGLGSEGAPVFLPLLSFNLGVEFGQLVFTVLFLPLIWRLRKIKRFEKYALPATSFCIIVMGAYWFIARAFGSA